MRQGNEDEQSSRHHGDARAQRLSKKPTGVPPPSTGAGLRPAELNEPQVAS